MPRYRVTMRYSAVEVVEAANPYMAALAVHDLHGDGVEVADVRPAVGRTAATTTVRKASKTAKATRKKRKPMSAENRAKLAQNLVKARAARARNAKAAKTATKK